MDPISIGLAVAGTASSIFGGATASRREKAAAKAQDKYNKARYEYDWKQTKREYKFRKKEVATQRRNQEQEIGYAEETAKRRYLDELKIQDFDFNNQVRAYNESERLYGLQRNFNAQAEALAKNAESNRFQEILSGMAFEQQDMVVKMLQEEGMMQARGVSGNSATKALGSAMAGYGRNQAIMAESLVSARRDSNMSMRQIGMDRYEADMAAQSRRMLQPLLAPTPSAPLAMPRAKLLNPMKPQRGPAPISGAPYAGTSGLTIAANAVNTMASSLVGLIK